jgi:hypothetical protein
MPRPLTYGDIVGKRSYWLVDITAPYDAGIIYRFASDPIEISDNAGIFYYESGLSDLSVDYSLGEASPQTMQLEITGDRNWADEFGWIGFPYGLRVEVRRYYEGMQRSDAPIIMSGLITDLSYGAYGEALRLTVEQEPWSAADHIPDPGARVSYQSWADPYEFHLGQYYPIVVGQPGIFTSPLGSGISAQVVPVIQGKKVGASQMRGILAGHRIDAPQVYIKTGTTVAIFPVQEEIDQLGNLVSYVGGTSGAITMLRNEIEFYWGMSSQNDWALVDEKGEIVRGAGHAIAWLMGKTKSIRLNSARQETERPLLDGIEVHFFINDQTTPFEFIGSVLANILPITLAYDHSGAYWRAWRDNPTGADIVGDLSVERREVERASTITTGSLSDVYNRFVLRFNQNFATQAGETIVDLTADDPDSYESTLCKYSQDRFGVRVWEETTTVVQDADSALQIVRAQARRRALPRRYVSYSGGLELERFQVGDIITVSDAEVGLSGAIATITAVALSMSDVTLSLEILDRPSVQGRATQ